MKLRQGTGRNSNVTCILLTRCPSIEKVKYHKAFRKNEFFEETTKDTYNSAIEAKKYFKKK